MAVPKGNAHFMRFMRCIRIPYQSAISLLIALLLSMFAGSVWAAVGTVLVTAGQNTIEDSRGAERLIARGAEINNGDTVYTGAAGHLQIRFVDGAIVALRPNTDFRVDEYRYPAAPQRSFLSLLRGALRSATGLASKDNPDNYRLTTPSATIGIRGTHFVAEETVCMPQCVDGEQAGLHVSVSEGAIIVTNDAGSIELNAGQSARVAGPDSQPVKTALAPVLSPRRYQPDQPPTPEIINPAPTQLALNDPAQQSLKLPDNYDASRRNANAQTPQNSDGSAIKAERVALEKSPVATGLPSRQSPLSDLGQTDGTTARSDDAKISDSAGGSDQAGRSSPAGGSETSGRSNQPDRSNRLDQSDLAENREWTIPGPTRDQVFDERFSLPATGREQAAQELGADTDYPDLANLPSPNERISLPRTSNGDFDLVSLLPAPTRQLPDEIAGGADESDNQGTGSDTGNESDAGDNTGASDSDSADNGGSNGGDSGSGDNNGSGSGGTPPVTTPSPAPGVAQADQWRIDLRAVPVVSRVGLVLNNQAILAFDDEVTLSAMGLCPNVFCLSRGNAIAADTGHDEFAAWGRWTDGSLSLRVLGLETSIALSDRDGLHYLVGVPAVSLPTQGSFSYPLVGATAPTTDIGWAPGQFSGAAAVQFAPGVAARIGLQGQIDIANERFSFATNGGVSDPGQSQLSTNDQAAFSGTLTSPGSPGAPWFCGSSGCAVNVSGGLLGPSGERLGVGYSVVGESGSTTIDGVAVFGRQ